MSRTRKDAVRQVHAARMREVREWARTALAIASLVFQVIRYLT